MKMKAILICTLSIMPLSASTLYLSSLGSGGITKYDNDLSQINLTPNGETFGITATSSALYWISSDQTNGTVSISTSDLNGTNNSVIHSFIDPGGLGLNSLSIYQNRLYWADSNGIFNSNTDGSDIQQISLSSYARAVDMTVANGYIYWSHYTGGGASTTGGTIYRSDLDGQNQTQLLTNIGSAFSIDVTGANIYWNDIASDRIFSSDLNGSAVSSFASLASGLGMTVTDEGIFVLNSDPSNLNITRFNFDGSNETVITSLDSFVDSPYRLTALPIPEPSSSMLIILSSLILCRRKRN